MSVILHAPHFLPAEATALLYAHFGIAGKLSPLPSERDQNFYVYGDHGEQAVLKIANALETQELLEAQNLALACVAGQAAAAICPQPLPAGDGSTIVTVRADDGQRYMLRLLTYLDGKPLALVKPHSRSLLAALGRTAGQLMAALACFDHPALHRSLHWDVAQAAAVIPPLIDEIADPQRRALVSKLLERFAAAALPHLPTLRHAVIHSDLNDYNVLVHGQQISGILDFGDMVYSVAAAEVAIAAAYALLDKPDPLAVIALIAGSCHAVYPLQETEIAVLFDLVCMRLAMSVCHAAHQRRTEPDNEYLSISERPAWAALERLAAIHPRLAHYTVRAACGLPPVPQSERIVDWLQTNHCALVIDADLRDGDVTVLDLSIGSALVQSSDLTALRLEPSTLAYHLSRIGGKVAIGRYGEVRTVVAAEDGSKLTGDLPGERAALHLGIDLFAPPQTPVYAALAGIVHALSAGEAGHAPGATVLLRHATGDGTPFYTRYDGLASAEATALEVGKTVQAGAQIGAIAALPDGAAAAGSWPPHLHLQIISDLLELDAAFPAAVVPSRSDVYCSLSLDPNLLLGIPARAFPQPPASKVETLAARKQRIGYNLSISYREPLKIVRGLGVHLYDERGRAYLDCVNNVAHVGHCHPHVVAAGQRQMGVLNTNTRYLHDSITDYARELTATLPAPLSVCFFVNSGSEANDLALRLARMASGQFDMITLDVAYHGHTQALIEVSPYKHAGPGGLGAPPFVQTVVMPDPYRGPHRGYGVESGRAYARHVQAAVEAIQAQGRGVAGFICESLMGCGGQIVLPDAFMATAFAQVRAAGGICIADEVQTGFGRVGSHFWGFATQGVVPDIVTVGKPAGNGHPLAAVITTPEIARKFANGMEYFNTFGGNAVSCAIGLAVLEVIEQEGLQANALTVGSHLMMRLRHLMDIHPLIGDVRGLGLYIGIELVLDRETRQPAGEQAAYIANRMAELGVLISTDGPDHNVLKIKPPIIFSQANADQLVDSLALVLDEDAVQVGNADF